MFLLDNVPLDHTVSYLYENHILSTEQREEIYSECTTRRRVSRLLSIIRRRGPNAYLELCNAFLVADRYDIISKLETPNPASPKVTLYRWKYIRSSDGETMKTSSLWYLTIEECRKMGEREKPEGYEINLIGVHPIMVMEKS